VHEGSGNPWSSSAWRSGCRCWSTRQQPAAQGRAMAMVPPDPAACCSPGSARTPPTGKISWPDCPRHPRLRARDHQSVHGQW